jgi:hypothetical protein
MTAAMLVLEPIFEADLPSELYAYRPGRNAQQAVVEVDAELVRLAKLVALIDNELDEGAKSRVLARLLFLGLTPIEEQTRLNTDLSPMSWSRWGKTCRRRTTVVLIFFCASGINRRLGKSTLR